MAVHGLQNDLPPLKTLPIMMLIGLPCSLLSAPTAFTYEECGFSCEIFSRHPHTIETSDTYTTIYVNDFLVRRRRSCPYEACAARGMTGNERGRRRGGADLRRNVFTHDSNSDGVES